MKDYVELTYTTEDRNSKGRYFKETFHYGIEVESNDYWEWAEKNGYCDKDENYLNGNTESEVYAKYEEYLKELNIDEAYEELASQYQEEEEPEIEYRNYLRGYRD